MKKLLLLLVVFLLSIGLISTLNGAQYLGLTGILNNLSTIDFSFSDTTQFAINAFSSFSDIGTSGNIFEVVESAVKGLFDLVRVPFVAVREFLTLLYNIFYMLFKLVGVF